MDKREIEALFSNLHLEGRIDQDGDISISLWYNDTEIAYTYIDTESLVND